MNDEITPEILQSGLHSPFFTSVLCFPSPAAQGSPRHRWTRVSSSSRHFLCLFVIFSQVVLGEVPDCLGTSSVVCAMHQEPLPIVCFANFHLLISLVALTGSVVTTASSLFPHANLCFLELCHHSLGVFLPAGDTHRAVLGFTPLFGLKRDGFDF